MEVTVPGIVMGLSTLKDGTIKVVIALNEISPEMSAKLFAFNNQYVKTYITNENIIQDTVDMLKDWEVETGGKRPSERLRNVLYRLWEQDNAGYEDSELFYRNRMEKLIESIKTKLI